jgi:predicted methyltransferase
LKRALLLPVLAFALLAASPAFAAGAAARLTEQLAAAPRSDADKALDEGRKPAEVIAFLGIEPGAVVMDVIAAGGWYSEVLSVAVGPEGRVYAQNSDYVLKLRDGANEKALSARLAGGRLPNVQRVDSELRDVPVPDASLDAALTNLNFHDVYNTRGEAAALDFLTAIHRVLEPGGVLGIIDHQGDPGRDNAKLHRIEKRLVLEVVAKSPFVLDAESDLLANASDDHSANVFEPAIRGHTDRFLLRLRKPR